MQDSAPQRRRPVSTDAPTGGGVGHHGWGGMRRVTRPGPIEGAGSRSHALGTVGGIRGLQLRLSHRGEAKPGGSGRCSSREQFLRRLTLASDSRTLQGSPACVGRNSLGQPLAAPLASLIRMLRSRSYIDPPVHADPAPQSLAHGTESHPPLPRAGTPVDPKCLTLTTSLMAPFADGRRTPTSWRRNRLPHPGGWAHVVMPAEG
jgi:hypothetical protein